MSLPDAVLWDMDGTLVDTEPFWMAEEHALVTRHHGSWDRDKATAIVGQSLPAAAEYIRLHGPVPLSPREIVDELVNGVIHRIRREVPWRPGAQKLLTGIRRAGVPCALVTMSWRSLVDEVLRVLPEGMFTIVVAGDEVTRGKPDPEPYLRAAELLGVEPHRCVAIEDSVPGVMSALQAGIPTLAVPHVVPIPMMPELSRAKTLSDITLQHLAEIRSGRPRDLTGG
ncbi:MAG: HAD family hydrolase [Actinomycetota bacterium]